MVKQLSDKPLTNAQLQQRFRDKRKTLPPTHCDECNCDVLDIQAHKRTMKHRIKTEVPL